MQLSLFENVVVDRFEEELIKDLKRGSSFAEGKTRIRNMYDKDISKSERMRLLKIEYGTGGYSRRAVGGISQSHDSTGIEIVLPTDEEKHYNWNSIHDSIEGLILKGEY